MHYEPGTHIVASLRVTDTETLVTVGQFRELIDTLIQNHHLQKLGEVYHNFDPNGFTAVVCLSESHLSIHTWPEHQLVNLDIYLSNYRRNNDGTVKGLFEAVCNYFGGTIIHQQTILR